APNSVAVQSSEPGTVYLVNDSVTVNSLSDITGAADNLWNSVAITAANTATDLMMTGLADGAYHAYAVDAAGNLSLMSTTSVTIDNTAPPVATIISPALTNDSTPVVSGTAEAGSTVTAVIAGATYTTVATGGIWSIDTDSAIPHSCALNIIANSRTSVRVTAEDAAGTTRPAPALHVALPISPPVATIISPALTNDSTPVVSGTAEAGATVTAVIAGATYTTVATGGTWSIDT